MYRCLEAFKILRVEKIVGMKMVELGGQFNSMIIHRNEYAYTCSVGRDHKFVT
jgi:hypothetical protein